jgi:hypothetical protein
MCYEILPEGGRPGQMLEVVTSRLFYEKGKLNCRSKWRWASYMKMPL